MSFVGTFRTWRDVRLESVMRTRADVRQRLCFIGSRPSDIRFGSGVFAPPIGPADHARCTSGPRDGPLIGGTESPTEASQRGLDQPRIEGNLCRLAVGIEFPGHSLRLQRRCDAAGLHDFPDNGAYSGAA